MSQIPAEMNAESTSNSNYVNSLTELKLMIATLEVQKKSLEQKLKEAEQRAQMEKNELEQIIQANQQKIEKFYKEMDKNGQQSCGNNLSKGKILADPKGIVWDGSGISKYGLKATSTHRGWLFAKTTEGYAISGECRNENFHFPGTIVFYYEVKITSSDSYWSSAASFGFTDGNKPAYRGCVGKEHKLDRPTGPIDEANVFGCGLLLNSKNDLAVFFTMDGQLLVNQTPINPTVNRLYPTVWIYRTSMEANFGNNLVTKPFKFDTDKCPGLIFE